MTGNIIGNQNPLVGTTYTYEIKPSGLLFGLKGEYEWYLFKKQKNGIWKDITGKPKKGEKVTYRFGEIGLGIEFQMKVYEIKKGILPGMSATKELAGSCTLIPTSDKVSKIDKVVLFNRGAKDVNKANYRDTLIAQAHCIAMFNKEIEFHLWEDDAPGKGHDSNINKNNRHTRSYKALVNEKGIAEVPIPLMSDEKILRQMANQFLMKGDKNEGANHEYYVTATYSGKIQGASQVNVDVANPDYKGQPQNQPKPQPKPKPQPQKDTPKFPAGQGGAPKQPDPKGNIVEAVFIDDTGKELSKVAVGDKVRIRIHSKNMVEKHIQYVVWEYDTASNDEVFRSGNIKITADIHDTSGFIITKAIFEKGIDSPIGDPDSDAQNYFIEIISKDLSAESQKFGVNSEGLMQVEKVKSAAGVQKQPKPEKPTGKKVCECEARVRAFIRMLRVKEGTDTERGYTTQYSGKQFSNLSKHPEEVIKAGKYSSSAAGAYQIMTDTWKNLTGYYQDKNKNWKYSEKLDYSKKYNITSFDQESQDKFCLVIMKHNYVQDRSDSFYNPVVWKDKKKKIRDTVKEEKLKEWRKRFKGKQGDIIQMIIDNDIKRAALISSLCWASLPDSPYGQQSSSYTFDMVEAIYEKNLKEELIEPSKELHLKKGFLKEFGYGCCESVDNEIPTSKSNCPEDCSQCFDYADVWENPEISSDNGGKNNNRFGYNSTRGHKGIDILSGPTYKDVHSLMCGEVTSVVNSFKTNEYRYKSLGNTLMIKSKDKDGKTVFILYCHLNNIYVKKGDKVKHGQKVAKSGSTGNASSSEFPNGVKGSGINKRFWHCHIEAATKGDGYNNFRDLGSYRVKAEDYMKTKFDKNGNPIK
ncbi:muramidase (phage lysozyme)/biotin carboxyl carrier protein [Chryseobacterium sediminis]|uniref:Muramidase (Phage lysozyme)/biotin carboxyl carrier protein n=1 Tax=Chryseobacterium sediminis TaxID=1679494 RepID=A0ABR6PU97_9FLAO|nr:peptidoglycan DD-metalloendopeptidase family protein [Chryseobacterium sediminis]MBB6329279.1 muramidase (phage lysozyme)/biotin carboxyl carrier protein [Chryseobacterium sediminis]